MKKLITTLLVSLIVTFSYGQIYITKDTTILGWNARITYIQGNLDSTSLFINILGAGEIGSNAAKNQVYLAHYWIANGWNGQIILGNGVHYPVYVTLQPPTDYGATPTILNARVDVLITRFKPKRKSLFGLGLSRGGWAWGNYIGHKPTLGDFSYVNKFTAIAWLDTQQPDDNYGSAGVTSFPAKIGNAAKNSNLKFWIVKQKFGIAGGDQMAKNVFDSVGASNRVAFFWTTLGGQGHEGFNEMTDPSKRNWTLANTADIDLNAGGGTYNTQPVAAGQNIWEWMLRQGDTTLATAPPATLQVNAGPDQLIELPLTLAYLPGLAAYPGHTITSYTWSKISGPSGDSVLLNSTTDDTLKVHKLQRGTYVYRLTVTDDVSGTAFDNVTITVGDRACNLAAPVTYYQGATQPGQIYLVGAAADALPWKGGDTVYITAGNYPGGIQINKISGDKCRPIIIKPAGIVTTPGTIRFQDGAKYFILDGMIGGVRSMTSQTFGASMTSNFKVTGINIGPNPSGVGIYIKQDPYIDRLETYDGSYIMKNIIIDNIRLRNVEGEGMYIGNTAPNGDPYHGNLVPIRLDSITISNNDVDSTGWDGIQLSNARNGNKIFGNKVRNFGRLNLDAQRAGIILGGNSRGDIYNNDVAYGTGNGIQVFGYGVQNIYGNTIDSVGNNYKVENGVTTPSSEQSIYGLAYLNGIETNPKLTVNIYNNTFIKPLSQGAIDIRNPNTGPANMEIANLNNNTFCIVGDTTNWQTAYLKLGSGWTGTNNIINCGITPPVDPPVNPNQLEIRYYFLRKPKTQP